MERARDAEPVRRRPAAERESAGLGGGGLLSEAIGASPAMVAQRRRFQALVGLAAAGPAVVQRHVFLDIPTNLHEVADFGNWYTIAAEYRQQKVIADLESLKQQSGVASEGKVSEGKTPEGDGGNNNNAPQGPLQAVPAPIDPADFVSSLRDKGKVVQVSLKGGVKMQVHGLPTIPQEGMGGLKAHYDLKDADLEKDGGLQAGKNVAIGQAIVSAALLADYITKTYGVPWEQFYPMYCFAAEPGGQWGSTKRGGLGAGPLLNAPGQIVTFDRDASMADWTAFEGKPKKYISAEGGWNPISVTPLAGLTDYIQKAKAGNLSKAELAAVLRTALDEVYAEVAPEYDAFRRYLDSKGAITGTTPSPWGA